MTTFTSGSLVFALLIASLVGVGTIAGFNSQQSSNGAALNALQKRMGSIYTIALFASGGLPTAAMCLGASVTRQPTLIDSIVLILLIGLGMIASYTLLGNAVKLLGEYVPDTAGR